MSTDPGVVQPTEPRPPADAGHPLLQRLIDSIEIVDGVACWDFLAMYEVRNALAGAPVVEPQPPSALTTFHQAWAYAKANAGTHSDGYRKDAFVHVQFWLERMPSFGAPVAEPRPPQEEMVSKRGTITMLNMLIQAECLPEKSLELLKSLLEDSAQRCGSGEQAPVDAAHAGNLLGIADVDEFFAAVDDVCEWLDFDNPPLGSLLRESIRRLNSARILGLAASAKKAGAPVGNNS